MSNTTKQGPGSIFKESNAFKTSGQDYEISVYYIGLRKSSRMAFYYHFKDIYESG